MRVFTAREVLSGAVFPWTRQPIAWTLCFLHRKRKMGKEKENKGGKKEGKKERLWNMKKKQTFLLSQSGKHFYLFIFFSFSAWQRMYGCKCYPVLNQINFPFKKKSKQIGLKEANCIAWTYYLARLKWKPILLLKCRLRAFPSSI